LTKLSAISDEIADAGNRRNAFSATFIVAS
jgi:hypothetical protein